ncbi:MAG: trigger factor [Candidatus Gracilibacteria bacterium]|nr:trigger factor [Candidatus Gracilibacteria bacterium]MDD5178940.1 trigger factor [Candidatus Gracilibacteria bacterium]
MKISLKTLPKSEVEITIEAEAKDLAVARETAVKQLSQEVKIPGFRAGSIPEDVLVKKIGEGVIHRETLDIALQLLYTQAVKEKDLKVIARPEVKIESEEPFRFTAKVAVLPEIKIGEYKKIKLKKEVAKVEKKEIEAVIADIQKNNAVAVEVKDRAAKKGDRVEIDFAGFTPDGVPLDQTDSKNHPLILGEGNFIPGFEEGVEGMKIGEEKTHPVKFPADYRAKHLAGADVNFKIKLHKIEDMQPPKLDDAFAEKVSGGMKKTWAEVEKDIEEYLKSQKENAAIQKLEQQLIDELTKISEIEIPASLIEEEVEYMLHDFKHRLADGGMKWEDYLKNSKKEEVAVRKEMSVEAEKRVKIRLILDKLVEIEKVEITDAELTAEIERYKAQNDANAADVEKTFGENTPGRIRLRHQLKVIKLLSELLKTLSDEKK